MPELLAHLQGVLPDRYRLERELGRGGMATVYLAHDLRHDRRVALKVLHAELASALGPERFNCEIKLVARLQHPHILPVLDSGEESGGQHGAARLWFAMPYVEGETLRDRLRREKQLPLEDALRIAADTARALDYAHRHGVIHRDIKPENILVTKDDGDALLADFGIGVSFAGSPADRFTETGILVGTPAYMSPEQAAGERQLDSRTDIYSLAVVLYELLAGEPPFTGPTAQAIIAKRFSGEVPHVRRVRPSVPESVERVLHKALASTPADRFSTAAQFAEALGTAAVDATNPARPTGPVSRSASFGHPAAVTAAERYRRRYRTALLVAGVLTALVALFAWMRTRSTEHMGGDAKRLAVLPFENLGLPEQEYFADGVTDEITTRLGDLSGLGVISRRSAMAYKSTDKPLRQVGAELGVAYILEGTVRWNRTSARGGSVRVTPQLIEVDGDRQIWAKSFEVDLSDVFGIQRRIAEEVARSLGMTLLPSDSTRPIPSTTGNLAAYDAYLRGNAAFFHMATTGGNVAKSKAAIIAYREAVRLDPGLALAWARLAQAIAPLLAGAPTAPEADARLASEAAERAVALAPDLAESQLAMAAVSSAQANKLALKRAFALSPSDPQVLQVLARRTQEAGPHEYDVLVFRGIDTLDSRWRCRAALQLLQRATVLDPRSIPILRGLYGAYRCVGDRDRAEAAINRAIEIAPELPEQWQFKAGLSLAEGNLAEARAVMREAKQHVPRDELVAYMAVINDQYWVLEEPDQQFLLGLRPHVFGDPLGWALSFAHTLALRGDSTRERAYADTALKIIKRRPDANLGIYEAMALAYLDRRNEALIALQQADRDGPGEPEPGWAYTQLQVVRTYNLLGDRERAIAAFLRFINRTQESLPLSPYWRLDPITVPLRGDSRYEALFRS
jgi:eukaryotic-like serine/threonine-protein kinase